MLFSQQSKLPVFLKMGLFGATGSGKTYTATQVAIGLHSYIKSDKPIFFLDTEGGSAYIQEKIKQNNISLATARTRAFSDLINAVNEAEKNSNILIIDSITHFWEEFCNTYSKKKEEKLGRKTALTIRDWNYLKQEWSNFTNRYINSNLHIIMCGRESAIYEVQRNEDNKAEMRKVDVKMKAETNMGYEPSLLIYMKRINNQDDFTKIYRVATILKDRFDIIDGKKITNPTFGDFLPHIEKLKLQGEQQVFDEKRSSEALVEAELRDDGEPQYDNRMKKIIIDEIKAFLEMSITGQGSDQKKKRAQILYKQFKTASYEGLEKISYSLLKAGYNCIKIDQNKEATSNAT